MWHEAPALPPRVVGAYPDCRVASSRQSRVASSRQSEETNRRIGSRQAWTLTPRRRRADARRATERPVACRESPASYADRLSRFGKRIARSLRLPTNFFHRYDRPHADTRAETPQILPRTFRTDVFRPIRKSPALQRLDVVNRAPCRRHKTASSLARVRDAGLAVPFLAVAIVKFRRAQLQLPRDTLDILVRQKNVPGMSAAIRALGNTLEAEVELADLD